MGQIYPMGQTVAQFAAKQLTGLLRVGKTLDQIQTQEALHCFDSISQFNGSGDQHACIICKTQNQTTAALPLMPFCHAHLRVIIDASTQSDDRSKAEMCDCEWCISCERGNITVWEGRCYRSLVKILSGVLADGFE